MPPVTLAPEGSGISVSVAVVKTSPIKIWPPVSLHTHWPLGATCAMMELSVDDALYMYWNIHLLYAELTKAALPPVMLVVDAVSVVSVTATTKPFTEALAVAAVMVTVVPTATAL